jgi:hypothetical protein
VARVPPNLVINSGHRSSEADLWPTVATCARCEDFKPVIGSVARRTG